MDFDLPADDDPRRLAVRTWLAEHPSPSGRDLAEGGWVVPHWPAPFGFGADPIHQLVIDEEFDRAGVRRPSNPIGIGWAGPTILLAGTDWQKETFLPRILSGEDYWCQLFSEPDSGSDLASLATRAERDGDDYIVNGSKIWTSGGHYSKYGILIARTNPDAPKHRGISYFICPMDLPGIELQPIIDMTTAHSFNQVFFTDVRLPAKYLVGEENEGWRLAKVTLGNERVSLSSGGALWGTGPSADDVIRLVREAGGCSDPHLRDRLARLHIEGEVLRLMRLRILTSRVQGRQPGAEASVQKLLADEHGQHIMEVARDLVGAQGLLAGAGPSGSVTASGTPTENNFRGSTLFPGVDPIWHYGWLFAPALTLGGGTWAVQRNIVAERSLGLPHDIDVEQGLTWSEARGRTGRGERTG
jgi:alkylation response protein AidB-like acyl-CoA dehydrogenase